MDLERFTENGFTVVIDHDQDAGNPRDDAHGCELVMSHRRYSWPNDAGIDFGAFDSWGAVAQELTDNHGALVIATVYAYDHSGISFKTGERAGSFADPWDSGIAGLAYVTRQNWEDTQGQPWTGSDADLAQARRLIAGDVETYGQWANGECYGYTITDEYGDQVDACAGYIGWDSVTEAAKAAANGLEHEIKCNGALDRASGKIAHAGPCPLHGSSADHVRQAAGGWVTVRGGGESDSPFPDREGAERSLADMIRDDRP